jgi:hypothetical protein
MGVIITLDDVLHLENWIARGKDEATRERRLKRAQARLFPLDLDALEIERRKLLVERAQARRLEAADSDDPLPEPEGRVEPEAVPAISPTMQIAFDEWEGFIDKTSPAYHRGSLHDGTQREVQALRSAARGNPFDVGDDD